MVCLANNKFTIPKYFGLYGYTIEVIDREDLIIDYGFTGLADYKEQHLYIQKALPLYTIKRSAMEKTFFHELVHFCLALSGYEKISCDETLVDCLGRCLHQAFKTAVYNNKFDKIFDTEYSRSK